MDQMKPTFSWKLFMGTDSQRKYRLHFDKMGPPLSITAVVRLDGADRAEAVANANSLTDFGD